MNRRTEQRRWARAGEWQGAPMGVVLAFLVGWVAGAKVGAQGYREVVDAARAVAESEEFAALVEVTRTHAATALRELSKLVAGETPRPEPADLLARVQQMTG